MWSHLTILDSDREGSETIERTQASSARDRGCTRVIGIAGDRHSVDTYFLFFAISDRLPDGGSCRPDQDGTHLPMVQSIPFLAVRLLAQRPPQRRGKTPFPALPFFSIGEPVSRKVGSSSFYVWCRVARGGRCINRSPTLPALRESILPKPFESGPLSPSPQPTGCPERGASLAVSSKIGSPATSHFPDLVPLIRFPLNHLSGPWRSS